MPDARAPNELNDQVRATIEAAVGSCWQFFGRAAEKGLEWNDIDGCRTLADYRAKLASEPGLLLETCQALLEYDTGLTPDERADCRRVVAIADALALRGPAVPAIGRAAEQGVEPPAAATEVPAPAAQPLPASGEPAAALPRRSGLWLVIVLTVLGAGAGLLWLWSMQPGPPASPGRPVATAPVAPAVPTATASPLPVAATGPAAGRASPAPVAAPTKPPAPPPPRTAGQPHGAPPEPAGSVPAPATSALPPAKAPAAAPSPAPAPAPPVAVTTG